MCIWLYWIKSRSETQSSIVLSSIEFWFHASVQATVDALGARSMANDFARTPHIRALGDAFAVLDIIVRRRLAAFRHHPFMDPRDWSKYRSQY